MVMTLLQAIAIVCLAAYLLSWLTGRGATAAELASLYKEQCSKVGAHDVLLNAAANVKGWRRNSIRGNKRQLR